MKNTADIIIIGAGPVGIYLGWQLAKRNNSVIILERNSRKDAGSKMDQFHLETMVFEKYGIPPPMEGTDELITNFEYTSYYGPYGKYQQVMKYPVTAMRFQFFIQRLIGLAEENNVHFQFSTEYKEVLIKDNHIIGIKVEKEGNIQEFLGKLIVDATGSSAVVRSSLPKNFGVETFKIEEDEKMYVIQRVIQWKNPDEPHPGTGEYEESISWLYYKTWLAPHFLPNANIFGGGQPGGYGNQEKATEIFLKEVPFPLYDILEIHKATTAYRRPPYSLVGNGFLCVGDSACMSKSFSGEAIESSWNASLIAVEVIDRVLKKDQKLTMENLWQINIQYFRGRGAKLAALLAQIPGAANTTKKDVTYLFKHNFIFSGRDFTSMWENLELEISFGRILKIVSLFLWGLLTRQFSRKALSTMLRYMKISGRIRKHYEEYPENINDFEQWVEIAEKLWNQVEKMKFTLVSDQIS
ncbi:MAG: FAD-dependent oxidoreductase [Candidatus Lokiarchaeota archaeon]|nr:FAD-dependent oxidoreductase [Candidatus Lokiarchaeota archaeon]